MKKCAIVFLCLVGNTCWLRAQDGKILGKKIFEMLDTAGLYKVKLKAPANYKEILNGIEMSEITYQSDSFHVKGFLAVPKKPGKYPCIIYNRGGERNMGQLTPQIAQIVLAVMANWGYVVVESQLRGTTDERETITGSDEMGGKEMNDIFNLIPLLASIDKADTSRIGMYGRSRGGLSTYMALAKTCFIKAAVVIGGLADIKDIVAKRPIMDSIYAEIVPEYKINKDSVCRIRSAVYWPDKLCKTTPILIMHGSSDWRVPPSQALTMAQKLYEVKHPFRFVFFEGASHGINEYRDEVDRLTKNWFDTYLRDRMKWPSMEFH